MVLVCLYLYLIKKQTTMELLEIEGIDFELNTLTAVFEGMFLEGFTVEAEFDYDEEQTDHEDSGTGSKDYFAPTNINFIEFKTIKACGTKFTINNRELKKIKQLVEFKLIDLLTEEINN